MEEHDKKIPDYTGCGCLLFFLFVFVIGSCACTGTNIPSSVRYEDLHPTNDCGNGISASDCKSIHMFDDLNKNNK